MFTPTPSLGRALRRLALTTKQAGKDYYKGTGSGAMGTHTKYGGYKIDWNKVRTYVVPDLVDFQLTPFVAESIKPPVVYYGRMNEKHPMSGKNYLDEWKSAGGDL